MPRKRDNSTFSRKYRSGHYRKSKKGKISFVRGTLVERKRKKK